MIDKRKRIYIGGGVAAAILLAVGLWLLLRPEGIYRAIPQSAVAVVETGSWLKVIDKLNTTYTGGEFKKTAIAAKLQANLTLMGNMLGGNAEMAAQLSKGSTLVSLHLASADSFDLLFVSKFSGVDDEMLQKHLSGLKEVESVNVRTFKGQKLFDIMLKNGGQFTISNFKGILSFSATTFLTEASVSALLTDESIASEGAFNKVRRKVSKDGDLRLYVNYKKINILLPVALKSKMAALLGDVAQFANWGAYNMAFSNNDIQLHGLAVTEQEESELQPQLANMLSLIPDNAAVVHISAADTAWLKGDAMASYFKGWMGNTKAFVTLEPLQEEFDEQNMLVLEVADRNRALQQLRNLIGLNSGSMAPVDTFLKDEIYYWEKGNLLNSVFSHSFARFGKVWFTVRGNVAYFSNNADVLMLSLEKINNGETLGKKETGIKPGNGSSQLLYLNPQRGAVLINALLKDGSTATGFLKQFLNITATSIQKGDVINTDVIMLAGNERVSMGLLWKTKLKTMGTYPPQIVWNYTTREKEILVQDTASNLYLLTRSGEILFTRNIGEPIIGNTYQLDYYSNGEYQYIFNSANRVYVIDRMGNDVGAYPLKLGATATAGLSLSVDTLLAINRYFIPCNNGAIYGYEGNGKPLPGWSPKTGVGNITASINAFNIGRRLYVSGFSTKGTLSLFDIRGNNIWTVELVEDSLRAPVLVRDTGNVFYHVQAAGNVVSIVMRDGSIVNAELMDSAECYTALAANDTGLAYYYSKGNAIRSYSSEHKFLKSAGLGNNNVSSMQRVQVGDKQHIAVQVGNDDIQLYDADLNKVAGFKAVVPNSYVFNDLFNRNEVIVISNGTGGNVSCTRLK